MARVFALANQKGGVGKTTTCINLAAAFAAIGQKVLLIDLDPQGNATMGSGVDKSTVASNMNDVLLQNIALEAAIIKDSTCGYHVLAGNDDLTAAEVQLLETVHREKRLYLLLESVLDHYDYIFIDCPPSLNMLTLNALVAADGVIIPMQCEYFALEGLSALVKTINSVRRSANPRLQIEGIVRTMYDPRNRLSQDVAAQLTEHFSRKLYQTIIPRNVRLAEAPSHGMSILMYDKNSRGAESYQALAKEILKSHAVTTA